MSYINPAEVPAILRPGPPGYPMTPHRQNIVKRIIVCCDGTWQDGLVVQQRWKYTNVLRLARAINHTDERFEPHVPQIVFYQSGVGTFGDKVLEELDGIVGASLADKVQEAYAFIAHNYRPGDEIFLFGFSRGAYTARMVALLIGGIGVLDRTEMDKFADIFLAYQKRGKAKDKIEIEALDKQLAPWTSHDSPGKRRADSDGDTFSIKCVGVFDTVGSLGLPGELSLSDKVKTLFGFPDRYLGEHIEQGFQALALDEHRKDFICAKFEQTAGGRAKGQILKQCWFSGSHSDIGGGFEDHDLSDISLMWMASNIEGLLALDYKYLFAQPDPVAPWGTLQPHNSIKGIYVLGDTIQRPTPTSTNNVTHEKIHLSVLQQKSLAPQVQQAVQANPDLVAPLSPLEQYVRDNWRVTHAPIDSGEKDLGNEADKHELSRLLHATKETLKGGEHAGRQLLNSFAHKETAPHSQSQSTHDQTAALQKLIGEHSMGAIFKDVLGHGSPRH